MVCICCLLQKTLCSCYISKFIKRSVLHVSKREEEKSLRNNYKAKDNEKDDKN